MTRALYLELALLFEREAEQVGAGQRSNWFRLPGTQEWIPSTFEGSVAPDFDEADRLDAIADELRLRAKGRAA